MKLTSAQLIQGVLSNKTKFACQRANFVRIFHHFFHEVWKKYWQFHILPPKTRTFFRVVRQFMRWVKWLIFTVLVWDKMKSPLLVFQLADGYQVMLLDCISGSLLKTWSDAFWYTYVMCPLWSCRSWRLYLKWRRTSKKHVQSNIRAQTRITTSYDVSHGGLGGDLHLKLNA